MSTDTIESTNVTTTTKAVYKYITKSRLDQTLKKYSLRVDYTKGQKEFRFLDTNTGVQVGETLILNRMHSLNIQEWRDAAAAARALAPLPTTKGKLGVTQQVAQAMQEDAAKVREMLATLE